MPRAFFLLLAVQLVSTLADSAFLIVAIARVIELAGPEELIPALKLAATFFYVLLAPMVGPIADRYRKGRVMLAANGLKVCAVGLLLLGLDPTLAIGMAGLGAAAYAPAKYGLVTELLPARDLVRANGWFEGITVGATIFGTALGGVLVSPIMPTAALPADWPVFNAASTTLVPAMAALLLLNSVALLLSAAVPDSGARYASKHVRHKHLLQRFWSENRLLWRDPLGGLSMAVTTLLWGIGATLQLLILRWAQEVLGLPLNQAAYLQGVTAIGVVAGAALASRYLSLPTATRVLPLGVVMGLLVPLMLFVDQVLWAAVLLVLVGALAGYFVVPMNALLQHRGCTLLTAGRSIAVQGFNENAGMLLMLSVYAVATAAQVPLSMLICSFGVVITLGMFAIFRWRQPSALVTTS
ncbi:MAG: hypothetical protein RLZZ591_1829 [Pseudomonadota bacterium]|jgi:MFS family permease